MSSYTAQNIIDGAFLLLNILDGERSITPTSTQYSDALNVFNDLIDAWNQTDLLVYQTTMNTFSLIPGQQSYTVGTGGNFSIARPVKIDNITLLYSAGGSAAPMELPMKQDNVDEWASVVVKSTNATFPLEVYNDKGFPFMTLYFYPVPTTSCSVILYTWEMLSEAPILTTPIACPPGYYRALKTNLAVELASYYQVEPSPSLIKNAMESKSDINDLNLWTPIMTSGLEYKKSGCSLEAIRSRGYFVD